MISYYSKSKGFGLLERVIEHPPEDILWIDLFQADEEEKALVERFFKVELFTRQESQEIESSSRYIESPEEVGINLNFMKVEEEKFVKVPVSFIIRNSMLITQRDSDLSSFREVSRTLKAYKPDDGDDIFLEILKLRIDFDADLIEGVTDKIGYISRELVESTQTQRDLLLRITALQEHTISLRENIVEKQRILSAILKSQHFPKDEMDLVRIMIKDVGSLLDYTSFNFERLEFLQNTFLGLVDMEQNRVIKIFTVVTVIFMPPTLIASIYGMNFDLMPELHTPWGYPFALILMLISSILTLLFFRRKGWL